MHCLETLFCFVFVKQEGKVPGGRTLLINSLLMHTKPACCFRVVFQVDLKIVKLSNILFGLQNMDESHPYYYCRHCSKLEALKKLCNSSVMQNHIGDRDYDIS